MSIVKAKDKNGNWFRVSSVKSIQGQGGDTSFWDTFQTIGERKNYEYAFYGIGWNDSNYTPKYSFGKPTHLTAMFNGCGITDTLFPIDATTNPTSHSMIFLNASKLITIRKIIVNSATTFLRWFNGCKALVNIEFEGEIGNDISFAVASLLSNESVQNIIDHLTSVSTAKTVTFHANIVLSEAQKTTINSKGWTLVQ